MQAADRDKHSGFTLVELLIVVMILAILSAVVIPQFRTSTSEAKEANVMSNLASLRHAIELYKLQHADVYPTAAIAVQLTTKTDADGSAGARFGPYLRTSFPVNPLNDQSDILVTDTMPASPSGSEGWRYAKDTGDLRLNSTGSGPSGIDYFDM